jgi:uncharacterized Zn-binding protein involved in type VI secretion
VPVTVKVNGTANSLVHKGSNGVSVATIPDVCKTPSPAGPVPIPYPNISQSTMLAKGSSTVNADGMMIAIKGSEFSMSNGDNAGVAGGVKSSTFMKESTWILYSFDVKVDGQNACRLSDKMFHNHENTVNATGEIQKAIGVSHAEFCDLCKNCKKAADDSIASSKQMQKEYKKAGADPKNKTGGDIQAAIQKSLAAQGYTTVTAGTTDSDGNIDIAPSTDPCAPVEQAATMAHEKVHQKTQKAMEKKFGKGTKAFNKAWNDAKNWVEDEVNAHAADQKFMQQFKAECKKSCP